MHIFSVVVWLGGLMFQAAVAMPIIQSEGKAARATMRKINQRFSGFIWMSVWTLLATGLILMLIEGRFTFFQFHDRTSIVLGLKELIFILMAFYAVGYTRMMKYLDDPSSNGGFDQRAETYRHRVTQFRTISIVLGIAGILLAAAL